MDPSTNKKALALLLGLGFVCVFLLTPAGFETRPIPSIHPLGFVVLAGIFTTVGLNLLGLVLMNRRPRIAAVVVSVGFFLVFTGITIDQVGLFSTFGPPTRISVVEWAFVLIELGVLLLAARLYRVSPRRTAPTA
ncbi:MAG: hypothetical protein L3K10_08590 [Thermoplasmata archaeon]|nr:hypothetical protein [Thermoplasmata archaeon]